MSRKLLQIRQSASNEKSADTGRRGRDKRTADEWSARFTVRLPHKIGVPLGSGGCSDASAPAR